MDLSCKLNNSARVNYHGRYIDFQVQNNYLVNMNQHFQMHKLVHIHNPCDGDQLS